MSRLPAVKSRQMVRALERAGFRVDRQKGSHLLLKRGPLRVTVPMHSGDLKRGTVRSILEQAGIEEDQLIELL
jgi:predicted RNA binding protein YcfA (HicA-like mRNA interferase family)